MTNTQASALENRDRRANFPRIADLLAGKAMPAPSEASFPASPASPFTSELPTAPATQPAAQNKKLPALPTLESLRDTVSVSSAMSEPPVAMPAPVIKPNVEKKEPIFNEPVPIPPPTTETSPEPIQPSFDAPPIENVTAQSAPIEPPKIENKPIEPSPATDPFVTSPPKTETPASPTPSPPQQSEPKGTKTPEKASSDFTAYQEPIPGFEDYEKVASDSQLVEALLPIVETSLEKALYAPKTGLHIYLEPMLRATVRRALAEQMQTIHHFGQINIVDRMTWRLKALFTSRTYDDIVFERTHRYRVEEVYLLRYQSNSLISYASHDPSRHSTPRKIKYDLSRLIEELKDEDGELRKSFELPNHNTAVVRCGQNCLLLASVKGPINALVRADLDYVLSQVEQRFGERLRDQGQHFVPIIQPLLEGCLLIQSPPPPR